MNRSSNTRGPFRDDHQGWRGDRPQYVVTPVRPDDDPFGWGVVRDYLGFVLRAPRRHVVLAAITFALVFAMIAAAGRVMPTRWQVQATVLTQRNPLMSSLTNPGMTREWDSPTRAAREMVIRRENLIALTKQTDFVERYLASRAPAVRARDWLYTKLTGKTRTPEELEEGLVDTLTDRLWITTGAEGTVTFTFVWSDKEIALSIVKAALQSFLDERYAEEIKVVSETITILQQHDQEVQKAIGETVAQVEQKERDLRIRTVPRRPTPTLAPQPIAADPELARAQVQLDTRRRALASMEDFRRTRLAELQAQLAQQRGVYAEDHPTLQATLQQVESFSQPSPQIAALRAEVADLEKEVARRGGNAAPLPMAATAVDDFAEVRARLFANEDPRLELERRRMDDLLHQHSTLMQRIDAASVEMDTAQAAFKYRYNVIQPPQLPRKPLRPLGLLFLVAGLVAGVAMAFLVAALADLRTGRVVERWQVERALDLPILGEIRR